MGKMPTIPEYYMKYIDSSVNLLDEPKQCCPFHKENTPSFSYSIEKGVCSCFGKCHAYGMDVIELHRRNFKLGSRDEAEKSLRSLYQVPAIKSLKQLGKLNTIVNEEKVEDERLYNEACTLANCPERWIELDYVMQKIPLNTVELQCLVNSWKG